MNAFRQAPKSFRIAFIAILVVAVVAIAYAASLNKKLFDLQNPGIASQAEIKQTVAAVGRFLLLPTDETPTLATVSDPEKLKGQAFFANAQTGDKVLIYTNSRKAILWRPSIQKIIEVSPLNVPAAPTTPTSTGK